MMVKFVQLIVLAAFGIGLASCMNAPKNLFGDEPTNQVDGIDPLAEYSQTSLVPTDIEETANIPKNLKTLYSSFCINSRDYVLQDLKEGKQNFSSAALEHFIDSVKELGIEISGRTQQSIDRLSPQLANPDSSIQNAEDDIEKFIVEGQREIQASETYSQAVLSAFRSTFKTISSTIKAKIGERIAEARNNVVNLSNYLKILMGSCGKIGEYKNEIQKQFDAFRMELLNAQKGTKYNSITLDAVGCVTAGRINVLSQACNMVQLASGPLQSFINMKEQNARQAEWNRLASEKYAIEDDEEDEVEDEDTPVVEKKVRVQSKESKSDKKQETTSIKSSSLAPGAHLDMI